MSKLTEKQSLSGKSFTRHHFVLQALGGSGKEVFYELQKRLAWLQHQTSIKNVLIDSDVAQTARLSPEDCYLLTNIPAYDLVEELEKRAKSLPGAALLGDPQALWKALGPSDDVSRGSPSGERKIGLLALWYYIIREWPQLSGFLMESVRELKQFISEQVVARSGQGLVQQQPELTISQVFSACGGTGSATAVFFADLMHYLLRGQWGLRKVTLEADIMLPTVFLNHVDDPAIIQAKAYAFMLELAQRYEQRLPAMYLGTVRLDRYRPPYAHQYYYDGVNTEGRIFTSRKQVAQVISLGWQLRNVGLMADVYRGLLVHMLAEWPNIGAALGAYILELPVETLIQRFSYRTGRSAIWQQWLQSLPEAQKLGQQALRDFLNQQPDIRNLPAFQFDLSGEPLTVDVTAFSELPRQKIDPALHRYEQDQGTAWSEALRELVQHKGKANQLAINQLVEPLLNRPGGLAIARAALTELAELLEEQHQRVSQQSQQHHELVTQWEQEQIERGRRWWNRVSLRPRQMRLRYWQTRITNHLTSLRLAAQLRYVQVLQQHVAELLNEIEGWQVGLTQLVARLQEGEEAFLRQLEADRSVVIESVLNETEIQQLYDKDREAATKQAMEGMRLEFRSERDIVLSYHQIPPETEEAGAQSATNHRWVLLSNEGLDRQLRYGQQFWFHLRDLSLEAWLTQQGKTAEALMEELRIKSAPLVAVQEVRHIPSERWLRIIGSEHGETGMLRSVGQKVGQTIVATSDKHRIASLSTVHGLNPLQLKQSDAWRRAYEEALAQGRLLHVMPEFDPRAQAVLVKEEKRQSESEPIVAPVATSMNGKENKEEAEHV